MIDMPDWARSLIKVIEETPPEAVGFTEGAIRYRIPWRFIEMYADYTDEPNARPDPEHAFNAMRRLGVLSAFEIKP